MPRVSGMFTRRRFLRKSAAAASVYACLPPLVAQDAANGIKAALIGHTGAGNYGHDLDVALTGVPGVELVAIADPNAEGRSKAVRRSGARRQYSGYREMIAAEKPGAVIVAPRWSDQHHAMAMAALKAGAHLLTEKPFTTTLSEADELLNLAGLSDRKIAVAHQMRLAPSIVHLQQAIQHGLLGDLIEIRSWGKQDSRAGGEDMMVLGTHLFDMMRLFAGDAQWCTATMRQQGRNITRNDARFVAEKIGPVAGDEIDAQFGFDNGVVAAFTSRARLRETLGHWGMELLGSKGAVRIFMDVFPAVLMPKSRVWKPAGSAVDLVPVPGDPTVEFTAGQRGFGPANRRLVDDWLDAIKTNRQPACSGHNAMKAIEMVMAVYSAALNHARVTFPLHSRTHPLT